MLRTASRVCAPSTPTAANQRWLVEHLWGAHGFGRMLLHDGGVGAAHGRLTRATSGAELSGARFHADRGYPYILASDVGTGIVASKEIAVGTSAGTAMPSGAAWTFVAKIRLAETGAAQTVFGGAIQGLQVRISSSNRVQLLRAGAVSICEGATSLAAGIDYDIGATYDGATGAAAVYLDGLQDATATNVQTFDRLQHFLMSRGGGSEPVSNGFRLYGAAFLFGVQAYAVRALRGPGFYDLWEPRRVWMPVPAAAPSGFIASWARRPARVIGAGVH